MIQLNPMKPFAYILLCCIVYVATTTTALAQATFNLATGTGTGAGWRWEDPKLKIEDGANITVTGQISGGRRIEVNALNKNVF